VFPVIRRDPGESKRGEIEHAPARETRDLEAAASWSGQSPPWAPRAAAKRQRWKLSQAARGFVGPRLSGQRLDLPKGTKLDLVWIARIT